MDIQQNLQLFRELMLCDGNIWSWTHDAEGELLSSNCPDEAILAVVFEVCGCRDRMLELGKKRSTPVFLSSDTGLIWGGCFREVGGCSVSLLCDRPGFLFHSFR